MELLQIPILTLLNLVFFHWVADFICQPVYVAAKKSKSFKHLIFHTIVYSFLMTIFVAMETITLFDFTTYLWFFGITLIFHTATDFVTSKVTSEMFEKGEYGTVFPNWGAFSVIGFDQMLHYFQIFITYSILFQQISE